MARKLDRSLIKTLPFFQSMVDEDLDAVLAMAVVRQLPEGAAAFEQGAAATEFFALLNGRLKVMQTTADGQQVVVAPHRPRRHLWHRQGDAPAGLSRDRRRRCRKPRARLAVPASGNPSSGAAPCWR